MWKVHRTGLTSYTEGRAIDLITNILGTAHAERQTEAGFAARVAESQSSSDVHDAPELGPLQFSVVEATQAARAASHHRVIAAGLRIEMRSPSVNTPNTEVQAMSLLSTKGQWMVLETASLQGR